MELPMIIKFSDVIDYGETGTTCPHCGAKGRYVYSFICNDGSHHAAMSGCIKKYPLHFLAREHMRIVDKQARYAAQGWELPSWDKAIIDLIEKRINGQIDDKRARQELFRQKERMVASSRR